jgi:hypothetical protein
MPITATIPTNLDFPHRGELERDDYVSAQETAQDLLAGSFTTNMNLFATQANALEENVTDLEASSVASALLAQAQATLATTKASEANTSAVNASNSKNATDLLFNQTKNLTDNLVIPVSATYTYSEIDNNFSSEFEEFINFKLGE